MFSILLNQKSHFVARVLCTVSAPSKGTFVVGIAHRYLTILLLKVSS